MNPIARVGFALVIAATMLVTTLRQLIAFVNYSETFAYILALRTLSNDVPIIIDAAVVMFYLGAGILFSEMLDVAAMHMAVKIAQWLRPNAIVRDPSDEVTLRATPHSDRLSILVIATFLGLSLITGLVASAVKVEALWNIALILLSFAVLFAMISFAKRALGKRGVW